MSMRYLLFVFAALFPARLLACFDGSMYAVYHQDGFGMLGLGALGFFVALLIRFSRGIHQPYLPMAIVFVAALRPSIEWWRRGSGDCGIGFYESTVVAVIVVGAFLMYETFRYWYASRRT